MESYSYNYSFVEQNVFPPLNITCRWLSWWWHTYDTESYVSHVCHLWSEKNTQVTCHYDFCLESYVEPPIESRRGTLHVDTHLRPSFSRVDKCPRPAPLDGIKLAMQSLSSSATHSSLTNLVLKHSHSVYTQKNTTRSAVKTEMHPSVKFSRHSTKHRD